MEKIRKIFVLVGLLIISLSFHAHGVPNRNLQWQGMSCYYHSVLQCLYHIDIFRNYLLTYEDDIKNPSIINDELRRNVLIGLTKLFKELSVQGCSEKLKSDVFKNELIKFVQSVPVKSIDDAFVPLTRGETSDASIFFRDFLHHIIKPSHSDLYTIFCNKMGLKYECSHCSFKNIESSPAHFDFLEILLEEEKNLKALIDNLFEEQSVDGAECLFCKQLAMKICQSTKSRGILSLLITLTGKTSFGLREAQKITVKFEDEVATFSLKSFLLFGTGHAIAYGKDDQNVWYEYNDLSDQAYGKKISQDFSFKPANSRLLFFYERELSSVPIPKFSSDSKAVEFQSRLQMLQDSLSQLSVRLKTLQDSLEALKKRLKLKSLNE